MAENRGTRTTRDMMLSLGVLVLVIGVLMVLTPRRHYDAERPIDYTAGLRAGQAVAPYHLLAPVGLGPRWRATSVRYSGDVHGAAQWHLGFVTPGDAHVGVEMTNGPSRDFVYNLSNRGTMDGMLTVNGLVWQRYRRDSRKVLSISHMDGGVTTLITGTATYDELAELAAALR